MIKKNYEQETSKSNIFFLLNGHNIVYIIRASIYLNNIIINK